MSKLFVITFKRPALSIEKMTMDIDFAYDCEATGIPDVAEIRHKDALNKYEDVDMFECEEYEYIEFVKNDDLYAKFVRTGEHSMKPIEGIEEDVEVGTETHVEQLYLKLEMTRTDENVEFDYNIHVDDIGQIIFTPSNSGSSFTDVNRVTAYDSVEDVIDGNTRTFVVSLDATMLSDSDNFDWFYDIDEVGQAIITPANDDTSFLTVSVNDSLNLVTPINEDLEVGTEEYENRRDIVLAVISDLQNALHLAIDKAKRIEADFQVIGIHNADIDSYMIRYLEDFIENREGEVSCADFIRRIEDYEADSGDINEALENKSDNELDRLDIIGKFMRGELPLFSDDGEPDPRFIRLDELDTTDKVKHEYYYDPESESIVYYEGR